MCILISIWLYTVIISAMIIALASITCTEKHEEEYKDACIWALVPFINIMKAVDYLNSTML